MESLESELWDLVIAGTGLPQALLALSLSRSDLKILHVDKHHYYGGDDAGLSLDEAEEWISDQQAQSNTSASFSRTSKSASLAASRAYTLSLNPQIIYASSSFLPSLVTSRLHQQIDFLAVGSFYTLKSNEIQRIPSSREDVFADDSLSRRDKIGLMKLLRYIAQEGESDDETNMDNELESPLQTMLESKFRLQTGLQAAFSALALAKYPTASTKFGTAIARMRRHLRSMNYFGPGFAAVYPKYAGNAEIAQTACRAGAVGGATYLLGHGVASIAQPEPEDEFVSLTLSNGTTVRARRVVGNVNDLPSDINKESQSRLQSMVRQLNTIFILGDPLRNLFVQTSDSGPIPAVIIVLVDGESSSRNPIYLQIHSEETGECPPNQCCVYASTILEEDDDDAETTKTRLESAVQRLLDANRGSKAENSSAPSSLETIEPAETTNGSESILWSMTYTSTGLAPDTRADQPFTELFNGHVIVLPPRFHDIAFDDSLLTTVKAVWRQVIGSEADDDQFLVFEERNQDDDE